MKKNVASQVIGAQVVSATDGSAFTAAVTAIVTGDGGAQGGGGACTHEGNGFHTYLPTQAETNYTHVGFTFTGTGAIPVTVQVYTTFPQAVDLQTGITGGTVTTVSGNVTGSVGSVVGAVGSVTGAVGSVTGLTAATVHADLDDIQARLPAALVGGRIDATVDATGMEAGAAGVIADAVLDEDMTAHQTQGSLGQAIGDPVADTNTIFKAVVTDAAGATVGVDIVAVKAETAAILVDTGTTLDAALAVVDGNVDAILVDTAEIGAAGAGLTAINLPNQTMDIVGSITGNLSGSVGSVTGAVGSVTGAVGSVAGAVGSVTGNVSGNVTGTIGGLTAAALKDFFDTDSATTYASAVAGSVVKEIADNAGGTPPSAAAIADAVWDEAIAGHVGAGSTGEALGAAGAAGDPWVTALPGAYGAGSAGKIIGDISGTKAVVDAILVDTGTTLQAELDAIQAKTDNLPSDPADASVVAGLIATAQTAVDAIKAKTDNLPSDPADASVVAGLIATAQVSVDAVKVVTDALTAAAAAKLAQSAVGIIPGAAVTGTLSTTQATTNLTEVTDDHYNGRAIVWTSGVLTGQASSVSDYAGATKLLTFVALTEAPSNGDTFVLV